MKTPYETMFLLPPTVTVEHVDELIDRLSKGVEKKYGEIVRIEKIGMRKTAYEVNNHKSAYYVLIQYRGTGETILEMERMLKNTDEVMKLLSTKITTKAAPANKGAIAVETAPAEAEGQEATAAAAASQAPGAPEVEAATATDITGGE